MKKIQYTTPTVTVVRMTTTDGMLVTASAGDGDKNSILGNGGDTGSNNINSADVKSGAGYNVWDDDWSR